jgi:hypothetical protein
VPQALLAIKLNVLLKRTLQSSQLRCALVYMPINQAQPAKLEIKWQGSM